MTVCSYPGCDHDTRKGANGLCSAHRLQQRSGKPLSPLRPMRDHVGAILAALSAETDECIKWAGYIASHGYPSLKWQGQQWRANRLVCVLAHGAPQRDGLVAAHSCGNRACINPAHLRWATGSENQADRIAHGTDCRGEKHPLAKLAEPHVRDIRRLARISSHRDLADRFGVSIHTIVDIVNRRSWRHI